MLDVRHVDPTSVLLSRSSPGEPSWIENIAGSVSAPVVVFDTASTDVLPVLHAALADGERVVVGPECLGSEPLIELIESSGLGARVFVCLPSRFDALATALPSHAAAGSIGTPLILRICAPLPLQRVTAGRAGHGDERYSVFDLCRQLLGSPAEALCHRAERHAAQASEVITRHVGGALATIWFGDLGTADVRVAEIVGTDGSVCIDSLPHRRSMEMTVRRVGGEVVVQSSFAAEDLLARSLDILADQLLRWVRSDRESSAMWSAVVRARQFQVALPEPPSGWVDLAAVMA